MIKKVTVFCASSQKIDEVFFEASRQLAKELSSKNIEIIYGGGSIGLMGALADAAIENGGRITGIIPKFMADIEWAHAKLPSLKIVETMHERKALMIKDTDCVIALPGGCGTLEELMEVITLKRLGLFTKPVVILNINEFYNPLIDLFENMIKGNFLREEHKKMWTIAESVNNIFDTINLSPKWEKSAIEFASIH